MQTRIQIPARARRGDAVAVRAIAQHPMETGYRVDAVGKPLPRHIVETFACTVDGVEAFRARLHPATAANPYFAFQIRVERSCDVVFSWTDDRGATTVERARVEVDA